MRIKTVSKNEEFNNSNQLDEMINISNTESLGAVEANKKEEALIKLTDFLDITADGIFLKQGTLKSKNFVRNLKGWAIDSEGNAWFKVVTAAGYIQTFRQAAIPTSLHAGDVWFDSDDGDKQYRAAAAGATTIAAGAWIRVDVGANPTLIDALQTTNAPAEALATIGAVAGTNLQDSGEVVLNDIHVKNIRTVTYTEGVTAGNAIAVSDGNAVADNPQHNGTNQSDNLNVGPPNGWIAKKFTTTSGATAISKIVLKINNQSGAPASGTVTVSIRASDGTSPTGSDIDARTATVAFSLAASADSAELTATFGTPPAVSANTTYFVCVRQDDATHTIVIISNTTASAGDRKSADAGSSWSASTSNYQYYVTPYETGIAAGEYRLASGADTDFRYSNFVGITLETKSAGQTGKLIFIGFSNVQSSLTAGLPYYLGDTNGAITNPAGTNSKKIGIAFSATELLILNT